MASGSTGAGKGARLKAHREKAGKGKASPDKKRAGTTRKK